MTANILAMHNQDHAQAELFLDTLRVETWRYHASHLVSFSLDVRFVDSDITTTHDYTGKASTPESALQRAKMNILQVWPVLGCILPRLSHSQGRLFE